MKIIIILAFFSLTANAGQNRPIPICVNIDKLAAYEVTTALVKMCRDVQVKLDFNTVYNYMFSSIKSENTFSSCNSTCWLMSGTNDMKSCIDNHMVSPYVDSFMENSRSYGENNVCGKIKQW